MILYPAIDIKDGKVVRLSQGKFDQVTNYSNDPIAIAKEFETQGAQWLHVVDLDGAKDGIPKNIDIVIKIANSVKTNVQTGGGIREEEYITKLIEGGVKKVILGTKVTEDKEFLNKILDKWQDRIAISIDCINGFVAQRGWTVTSDVNATTLVKELETLGVLNIIYTDISRDGMLNGPNFEALKILLKATKIPVIASGGVASLDDIKKLKALEHDGVMGAIVGKALYEGKFNLKDALALC